MRKTQRGDIDIALEGENRKSSGSFIDIPLDDKKTKVKKAKSAVNGIDTDIADSKEENAADKDLSQDLINIINRARKPMGKSARQYGFCNCRGYLKRKVSF